MAALLAAGAATTTAAAFSVNTTAVSCEKQNLGGLKDPMTVFYKAEKEEVEVELKDPSLQIQKIQIQQQKAAIDNRKKSNSTSTSNISRRSSMRVLGWKNPNA
jgi:hypothetical protein